LVGLRILMRSDCAWLVGIWAVVSVLEKRLHAHVLHAVAPPGDAAAAAVGADLDEIHGPGRQVIEEHGAAVGVQAAVLPGAGRTAGTDGGEADFAVAGAAHGHPQQGIPPRLFRKKESRVDLIRSMRRRNAKAHRACFAL